MSAKTNNPSHAAQLGARKAWIGIGVNSALALVKAIAGILGNSYALIADAIESASDINPASFIFEKNE
jgi:divalent metal cation (Fe/Co/Zn/Cd) transporter